MFWFKKNFLLLSRLYQLVLLSTFVKSPDTVLYLKIDQGTYGYGYNYLIMTRTHSLHRSWQIAIREYIMVTLRHVNAFRINGTLCRESIDLIFIEIYIFSFKKMRLKMSSGKCRQFCLGLNVLSLCYGVSDVPGVSGGNEAANDAHRGHRCVDCLR